VSAIEDLQPLQPSQTEEELLTAIAKEYVESREVASEANARKEAARAQILALLGDFGKAAAGPFLSR
jgi:hypothetical protein